MKQFRIITRRAVTTLGAAVLAFPAVILAQQTGTLPDTPVGKSSLTAEEIVTIIKKVTGWMQGIFFLLATIFILYAAFTYLTSGGDEEKTKKAKNIIVFAIIAIAVALLATAVTPLVQTFLGTDISTP